MLLSLRSRASNLKVVVGVMATSSVGVMSLEVTRATLVLREQTQMFSPHSVTILISDLEQLPSLLQGLILSICRIWGLCLMSHNIPSSSDMYYFIESL